MECQCLSSISCSCLLCCASLLRCLMTFHITMGILRQEKHSFPVFSFFFLPAPLPHFLLFLLGVHLPSSTHNVSIEFAVYLCWAGSVGQHAGSSEWEALCSVRGEGRLQLGMLQQVYRSEVHNSPVLSSSSCAGESWAQPVVYTVAPAGVGSVPACCLVLKPFPQQGLTHGKFPQDPQPSSRGGINIAAMLYCGLIVNNKARLDPNNI